MKIINKLIGFGALAGMLVAMSSCAQEEIFQPNQNGIPQASDYQIGISVDDLNNVELNILDKNGNRAMGVYPIWYVNNSERPSTALTYRDLITIAGDYPVEMKVGNANGVSEGSVNGTIVINKTIFDFTPYMRALTNDGTKEWAVDGTKQGNMGCGPNGNPIEWWSAAPGDKESEGVYANVLVFGNTGNETSGSYIFDPASAGTFYVNKDVHSLPGFTVNNPDDGNDFRVASGIIETTFNLVPEGASLYLELPGNTPFPYVPSEAGFAAPKYKITSFSKSEIVLVQDLEGISWQYIIAPKADAPVDVTTTGFKYDYEHNMWKFADVFVQSTWFADANWGEFAEQPEVTVTENKGIKFHTPAGVGPEQWQGQVHVGTDIEVHAGVNYDFSCKVIVPKAGAVTVKVQKDGDDNTYFVADRVDVEADGDIVWFADMEGFDGTLKIAFDFGGYDSCDIEVSDIVFKEHQYDDGTVIPAATMAPTIDPADNLFANYEVVHYSTWFADSNWNDAAITQPEIVFFPGGYSFTVPEGIGGDQWQGQVHMWTNVATSAANNYDFIMTIESDEDVKGVTVKIQNGDSLGGSTDDDNIFFVVDRVDLEGGTPYLYFFKNKPGIDTSNLQICMDYAGAPGNSKINITNIQMAVAK